MIEIPIADAPDQQFSVVLGGRRVTLRLRYNVSINRWAFDLSIDDLPILHGRRVVTGVDLIKTFNLGIGAVFAAVIVPGAEPGRNDLPSGTVKLFHATDAEIATVSS